ncbi:MAG: lipopolysaccharide biosynthesis protein [Ruminococcaceae bacterium]|nr:lipopolysaccharide biosynthesis protein [Oscillospiraceae bacterium]
MMNLLFCGNDKVFDGILTCALSIFKRSRNDEPVTIYLYTMDLTALKPNYTPITEEMASFLEGVAREYNSESRVILVDVGEYYRAEFAGCPNESAYCSPYTLIRLFADLVPGMPDKLLYLDADLLFNRDIHLLYDIDVEGYEYAAARDHYGKYLIHPNYVNAGVLLFNLKYMKETNLLGKARDWIRKKKLVFADQSAIIRSTTQKKMLPQKFNDQKFLHKHTVVRHFSKRLFWLPYPHTDNVKQWQVTRVHKIFRYFCFDDILFDYLYLRKKFDAESKNK